MSIQLTEVERRTAIRRVEQMLYDVEEANARHNLSLMSPARVAGKLDVSLSTLAKLDLDKIDLIGNGKVIRYRASVVDAYLTSQTING